MRLIWGCLVVVAYGLALYAIIWSVPDPKGPLKLISGALLLSMSIGSLSSVMTDPLARLPLGRHIYVAMIELLVLCLLVMALFAEGVVCLVMAMPIMIPGVILGVWIAWATMRWWQNRVKTLPAAAALPLAESGATGRPAFVRHAHRLTSGQVTACAGMPGRMA